MLDRNEQPLSLQGKEREEILGSSLRNELVRRETKPSAHAQLFISRGYVIGNVADSRGRKKLKTSEKGSYVCNF